MPPASDEHHWLRQALPARYSIVRTLGRGSTGAVVLAHDRVLQRWVAIKALLPEVGEDPERREQFHREALTNARLAHPNIVPVFDYGDVRGVAFAVMRYVPGTPLSEHITRERLLPPGDVCRILAALADALGYAHRQRVVHRDIKPENVILDRDTGQPMLTDFGIARAVSLDAMQADEIRRERLVVRGTVHFMSPEQLSGRTELDGRSDLYALGVLGYALLSGELPIQGTSFAEIARRHGSTPPPSLETRAPHAPPVVVRAVMRCLAKRPDDRWPDGEALRDALLGAGAAAAPRPGWLGRARRMLRRK
ncbi:MAG TPA: serine/threonine-protein kinase [Gemmatimonadaceae bacterium]|nr:serine/threonine-protein kinase [Gemmatimonadaceae bacterium]